MERAGRLVGEGGGGGGGQYHSPEAIRKHTRTFMSRTSSEDLMVCLLVGCLTSQQPSNMLVSLWDRSAQ